MFFRRILLAIAVVSFGVVLTKQGLGQKKSFIVSPEAPSCSDILNIFTWSEKNHGFAKKSLLDPKLPKKVTELFSEKLDPQRVLLTQQEVRELSQAASRDWKNLINQKKCAVFNTWFNQTFAVAKRRLNQRAVEWFRNRVAPPIAAKKPNSFASDTADLTQRQEALFNEVITKGDSLESFSQRLDGLLFPDHLEAGSVLAKAMLGALDPYSTYFSDQEFAEFYEELSGKTAGVGITVEKSPRGLGITQVTPKSPAELAGIKSGDQIVEVDGKSLAHLSFQEATQLLRGDEQTQIQLLIENPSGRATKNLTRTAKVFSDKRVTISKIHREADKKIALISIPSFYGRGGLGENETDERSCSEDLRIQLEMLTQKEKLDALILDLRGNPGGYLEEAITIAGFFLGPKVVVGVKSQEEIRSLKSDWTESPIYNGPLLVWVDQETASAGEVLAAALKDHQRALLVGTPSTFGKGSVQKLIRLDDPFLNLNLEKETGVIKLTTSLFFSPLGHSPANGGVTTHVSLKQKAPQGEVSLKSKPHIEDVSSLLDSTEIKDLEKNESRFLEVVKQIQAQEIDSLKTPTAQIFDIASEVVELNS